MMLATWATKRMLVLLEIQEEEASSEANTIGPHKSNATPNGSRIINLEHLPDHLQVITNHAASCQSSSIVCLMSLSQLEKSIVMACHQHLFLTTLNV